MQAVLGIAWAPDEGIPPLRAIETWIEQAVANSNPPVPASIAACAEILARMTSFLPEARPSIESLPAEFDEMVKRHDPERHLDSLIQEHRSEEAQACIKELMQESNLPRSCRIRERFT